MNGSSPTDEISALRAEIQELKNNLRHRERQIEAMRRTTEALFSQDSLDSLIRQSLHVAVEVIGADAGTLQLHEPSHNKLVVRYAIGPATENLIGFSIAADRGIPGQVFQTGVADIASDVSARPDFDTDVDERTGYQTRSMVTVPLRRPGGKPIGVLQVFNYREEYDDFDLEVLEVITAQAAIAIEHGRLTQQVRKAELVNLIGDISHDIKNMLTPIQTGAWTLEPMLMEMFRDLDALFAAHPDANWVPKVAKATNLVRNEYSWILENALSAADKVQVRTKEIADVIKGESAPPRFTEEDFNEVAKEVFTGLRLVAYDRQVDMELDLDPTLPPVEYDHKQMYNALYNLVNNAIPETPVGGLITVRTRYLGPKESNFMVQVNDTGNGMPEYVREKLFTDEAVSTKPGGTGLGTRIVADVVHRHHGHINVESEIGKGSTFTILLPLKQEK
jgi:signal transduction histidine kinase